VKVPGVPARPFLAAAACLVLAPVLGRLPGIAFAGSGWLTAYLPVALMGAILLLIPAGLVGAVGSGYRGRPLIYWATLCAALGAVLAVHGVQRLYRGDSPAIGFVMIFVAAAATVAALAAWPVAAFLERRLGPGAQAATLALLVAMALALPAWHIVATLGALPAPVDVFVEKPAPRR